MTTFPPSIRVPHDAPNGKLGPIMATSPAALSGHLTALWHSSDGMDPRSLQQVQISKEKPRFWDATAAFLCRL